MGEFLRQELNPQFDLNIVCGAKDSDFDKLVYFEKLGDYQGFKNLLIKGPDKAPVGASLSEMSKVGKPM